ncbi:MAG: L-threonylcarbamoyladenylate synthase [Pseudomonadota bacterium]
MSADTVEAAVAELRSGRLIGLPTETVYGLAGDAANPEAVARIYAVKGRPAINPLIAHVADKEAAWRYGRANAMAEALAEAFWPGPLTLVLDYAGAGVSDAARAGLKTLAVRVPAHPVARAVLEAFGRAVVAPSANPSGRLSPTRAEDVRCAFGAAVPVVLDAGATEVGLESTIVDCTGERPRLLRPGGISREALEDIIGPLAAPAATGPIVAPGALASHYAPRARVRLNVATTEPGEARLGFGAEDAAVAENLSPRGDLAEAAHNLFAALRRLDEAGAETIAVSAIPEHGLGLAINDRLRRAAADRDDPT